MMSARVLEGGMRCGGTISHDGCGNVADGGSGGPTAELHQPNKAASGSSIDQVWVHCHGKCFDRILDVMTDQMHSATVRQFTED